LAVAKKYLARGAKTAMLNKKHPVNVKKRVKIQHARANELFGISICLTLFRANVQIVPDDLIAPTGAI